MMKEGCRRKRMVESQRNGKARKGHKPLREQEKLQKEARGYGKRVAKTERGGGGGGGGGDQTSGRYVTNQSKKSA